MLYLARTLTAMFDRYILQHSTMNILEQFSKLIASSDFSFHTEYFHPEDFRTEYYCVYIMTQNMGTPHAPKCVVCSKKTVTSLDVEQPSLENPVLVHGDVPPNGGYGWVCVACSFWINAHTWGINSVRFQFACVDRTTAD